MTNAMISAEADSQYRTLPKVELHCHVEGTARAPTVGELASKHGVPLGVDDPDDLYIYESLADYPHHEGGRNPLGRFERSLDGHTAETLDRFYADNFTRLFGTQL